MDEDIPGQAAEKGAWLMARFEELREAHPDLLHDVRGLGLLIGLEYCSEEAGYAVATGLFGEGVLVGGTLFNAKTFRIEPPATLTQHEMDEIVGRLERVMQPRRRAAAAKARWWRTEGKGHRGAAGRPPRGRRQVTTGPGTLRCPALRRSGALGVAVDEQRLT